MVARNDPIIDADVSTGLAADADIAITGPIAAADIDLPIFRGAGHRLSGTDFRGNILRIAGGMISATSKAVSVVDCFMACLTFVNSNKHNAPILSA